MAVGVSILEVDGLHFTVERKAIRNLYLRVHPDGRLQLSAPKRASDESLRQFVTAKRGWLERQLTAQSVYVPRYVSGERFPLWGEYIPLAVEPFTGKKPIAALADGALCLRLPSSTTHSLIEAALQMFYRTQLSAALPAAAAARESEMGLYARKWQLRDMTSRWGSCTPRTGDIRLNVNLAKFPPDCLRYLITHELAHLRVAGHGPAFYKLVSQYEPAWRWAKGRLRAGAPTLPPLIAEKIT